MKPETFRIFVTNKEIKDMIREVSGIPVRFMNDKYFYTKVKSGDISVRNKVILFVKNSFSIFKKLIDDNYIQLEIRGIDRIKFLKLNYSTSILDNSKYILLDPANEIDKIQKIKLLTTLSYLSNEVNSFISYKVINKKYFVENYNDIMSSLGKDSLALDYETHGYNMMGVDSNFEILGVGICSSSIGYYIEFRNDTSIEESIFKKVYGDFIRNNNKRIWTYYCNFEIMVNYWYLDEFIELNDAMVLCIADENSGSLKYVSQYYLNSIDWESETNRIKKWIVKDIYESLDNKDKSLICNNILCDLTLKKLNYYLANNANMSNNPLDYDYEIGEYELYKKRYITSKGTTISYLPTKRISKYCIYDCYNTLKLKEKLYDKYKKAYDCFIKNIYLSIPLQNHGLLLDFNGLKTVSNKYEYILYNLKLLIAKFYYNYNVENINYDVINLLSKEDLVFFKAYGIESTYDISKKIIAECINPDIVGYLDYTSLYQNILDSTLRNKIIETLENYKSNDILLKSQLTASSLLVKKVNNVINNYEKEEELLNELLDTYVVAESNNDFNFYFLTNDLTNKLKTIISNNIKDITKTNTIKKIRKKIEIEFKKELKTYYDTEYNILNKLDNKIKQITILNSKEEFIKILDTYFIYKLVLQYKIGDMYYDKKTQTRYFKYLNRLELNDYILVNSCNNQKELDELNDITEEQKYKYSKIKFKQSFLDKYENIHNISLEFYNDKIVPLLKKHHKIVDIFDELLSNKLLNKDIFFKAISVEFDYIDYKNIQFNLRKLLNYYRDKDTLELLNTIDSINILEEDKANRFKFDINFLTPTNKQLLNKYLINNYKNIIYNFSKLYKTGSFNLAEYETYTDAVTYLESIPKININTILTYVKKTFTLLPQMRLLKYQYNNDFIETIDTSFNNDKSFEECAKLMFCINLYYKLDKVYTSYIHGNVIAKNTYNYDYIDKYGFTHIKNNDSSTKNKIVQSPFKMLSLKTKRSSSGIHTLNKNMEPTSYLNIINNHIGIYFDLSAAEVRCAAYMSKDEVMINLFNEGIDIYAWMRNELSELIDRNGYKAIVLGLIYGRSTESIAKSLEHLNPKIVIDGIEMFKNKFKVLWNFIEKQTQYCIEYGKINTMLGDLINVSSYSISKKSTVGMNYSVQGFTAALVAEGGYNVWKTLYDSNIYIRVINLVHDSLSYSVHANDFFIVYNGLNKLFIDYLYKKYNILFKFDLELFLSLSDKISIKKIENNHYQLSGKNAIKIFNILSKYHNCKLINQVFKNDSKHFYQIIDNDRYIKTPQNLYINNNFKTYNNYIVEFIYDIS